MTRNQTAATAAAATAAAATAATAATSVPNTVITISNDTCNTVIYPSMFDRWRLPL